MWVLASLVLGITTVTLGYHTMETEGELTKWYKADLTALEIKIENIKRMESGDKPSNIYEDSKYSMVEVEGFIKKRNDRYRQDVEQLSSRQLRHVLTYAAGWLIICVATYIFGSMLGWVYRGFSEKKV